MNRRKFLQVGTGGLLTVAAVGFPKRSSAQTPVEEERTYYHWSDTNSKNAIEIQINHHAVTSFEQATQKQRSVRIDDVSEVLNNSLRTTHFYRITSVKRDFSKLNHYNIKVECLDGGQPAKGLFDQTTLTFQMFLNAQIELENPASSQQYVLKQGKRDQGEDDLYDPCFLTTACVHHKGLADDGEELQTLRAFRASYMRPRAEGQALLDRYYVDGPAILQAVEKQTEPGQYYEHMYQHLVQPSLALIEAGKSATAMAYYRDYVVALKTHLQLP